MKGTKSLRKSVVFIKIYIKQRNSVGNFWKRSILCKVFNDIVNSVKIVHPARLCSSVFLLVRDTKPKALPSFNNIIEQ